MNEDKGSKYHRLKRRVAVLGLLATAALLASLVATGGSAGLRAASEQLSDLCRFSGAARPWGVVSWYVILLGLMHGLIAFPLGFYQGFWLEQRYGLSRQTARAWLLDHVKAGVVGGILGVVATNLLYAAIRSWPDTWWAVAGAGSGLLIILLTNLAPVVLLPLFFRFEPLDRPSLGERLLGLTRRAGTKVLGIYEWKLGEKTRKANAALVGLGGTRRILLSDTLLAEYSDDEIEVILAHELAHHVHRDIWKGVGFETLLAFAAFYLADRIVSGLSPRVGLAGPGDIAGLPILLLVAGLLSLILVPVANALSRRYERHADAYALRMTGNASAFISAMRRLGAQNLAEQQPSRLVQALFYTHPPLHERIATARTWGDGRSKPGEFAIVE